MAVATALSFILSPRLKTQSWLIVAQSLRLAEHNKKNNLEMKMFYYKDIVLLNILHTVLFMI